MGDHRQSPSPSRHARWRSIQHWIWRGCGPDDVRPSCAHCGYWIRAVDQHGICPECGNPYIPSTLQHRGPAPGSAWCAAWTSAVLVVVLLGIGTMLRMPSGWTIAGAGAALLLVGMALPQAMLVLAVRAASDHEHGALGRRAIVAFWSVVISLALVFGTILLPVGLGIVLLG